MQRRCFSAGVPAVLGSFSRPIRAPKVVPDTIEPSVVVSGYDITVYSSRLSDCGASAAVLGHQIQHGCFFAGVSAVLGSFSRPIRAPKVVPDTIGEVLV